LLESLAAAPRPRDTVRSLPPKRAAAAYWVSAALAASLLLGVGILYRTHELHERVAGLAARREVLEALRVTNQKLDLAYVTVRSESREEL
jgi:hypothetical protein